MASALESGKLVAASFLYRYWKTTPGLLKAYMSLGVLVLMFITSVGIYGYLSAAYAQVAALPQNTINQIAAIATRQTTLSGNVQRMQADNIRLESRREQVQTSLDNVLSGNTDLSQRSAFANLRTEIEQLDVERRGNIDAVVSYQTEKDSLENVKVQLNADLNTNSEIGTFIYISRTLGVPLDTVEKWFVLVIVFVFDPLAMALVLAYNSIMVQEQRQRGPPSKKAKTVTKVPEELMKKAKVAATNTDPVLLSGAIDPVRPQEEEEPPEEPPKEPPKEEPSLDGYIPAREIIRPAHTNVYGEEMPGILASEKILGKAKILRGSRKGSWVHIVDRSNGKMTAIYLDPTTGAPHRFKAPEAQFGPIQPIPIETGWSLGARIEPPRS